MSDLIKELTKEQEAQIPVYLERYLNVGLSTERCNRSLAERSIKNLFKVLDKKSPEFFIWVDSPKAALEIASIVEGFNQSIFSKKELEATESTFADVSKVDINSCKELLDNVYTKSTKAKLKEIRQSMVSSYCWGNLNAYWVGFYSYINEIVKKPIAEVAVVDAVVKNTGSYVSFSNLVIMSDRPTSIHFDENRVLHNTEGPAVEFPDGFKVFSLDGLRVPEYVFNNVKDKINPEEILGIENVEIRAVAMKYFGIEYFLEQLNSILLEDTGNYKLHQVNLFGSKEILLEMQNPSEDKKHYEFVDPKVRTISQALAWRINWDTFKEPTFSA